MDTPHGSGGVQGLGWFLARLLVDEDGDVADSFMVEDNEQHNMQHDTKVPLFGLHDVLLTHHPPQPESCRRHLQGAELFVEAGDVMVLTDA